VADDHLPGDRPLVAKPDQRMIPSKIFLEENTLKKSLTRVFEFGIYRIERLLYYAIPP
jgi:hypothetical protein